jgi:glutamine amidotransferase
MGWNRVWHGGALRLFEGIEDGARFYFVHSYFPVVASGASTDRGVGGLVEERRGSGTPDVAHGTPSSALMQAFCDYGVRFAAAIETGRIYATQFHPEKSQKAGIRMLENFAAIVKEGR